MGKLIQDYKVLLVDDNSDFQHLFKVYARKMSFTVMMASNGKVAVSDLARIRFDSIILDFMLPDLNGAEIFKSVRQDASIKKNRETPVIVVSAVTIPSYKLRELFVSGMKLFCQRHLDCAGFL